MSSGFSVQTNFSGGQVCGTPTRTPRPESLCEGGGGGNGLPLNDKSSRLLEG